jgi:anti-sigma B factor antagonist
VITETIGGVNVVVISTESLMANNVEQFKDVFAPLIVQRCGILIDMEEVRFVDSSGIGALITTFKKVQALEGELKLCSLTEQVRSIFEMVRVDKILEIYPTREEALNSFRK